VIPAETILIAGPTGAGKSALSLLLAERLGGEIVGADAFQIYAGLPILTAQPTQEQQARVAHHLLGHVDPAEIYDAERYRREALDVLSDIASRGKRPIVVGGTGLYLKSLIGGLDELPGRDPILRAEFAGLELSSLLERLRSIDPVAAATVDPHNRRRVERALEIVLLTGRPFPQGRSGRVVTPPGVHGFLLHRETVELDTRISANVSEMFVRGVEAEVAALSEESMGPTASKTLGLAEVRALLRGEVSRKEAASNISLATRRYAKRQRTWFRGQHDFETINLSVLPGAEALEMILARLGN
jgi:tRNA dimethylallyltransferase